MNFTKGLLLSAIVILFPAGCINASREAERNLQLLKTKALTLDSLITVESKRLRVLDSAISDEFAKAGKLDSVVTRESRRIDSLVNKLYRKIEQQTKQ